MFTCVLGRYVASTVLLVGYPNLSEGADNVGGAEVKIEWPSSGKKTKGNDKGHGTRRPKGENKGQGQR